MTKKISSHLCCKARTGPDGLIFFSIKLNKLEILILEGIVFEIHEGISYYKMEINQETDIGL